MSASASNAESSLRPVAPRIVNGVLTSAYPSVGVLLFLTDPSNPDSQFSGLDCSGTMIGCQTFLTAAHCVCAGLGEDCQGAKAPDPSHYMVFLQHAGLFKVSRITAHPQFGAIGDFGLVHDVAVVTLAAPVSGIAPTPINTVRNPALGMTGTIVGFGRTGGDPNLVVDAGLKRVGKVTVGSCLAGLSQATNVCWSFAEPIGPPGSNSGTCYGDSGGPLFIDFGSGDRVAGLTTGGNETCLPVNNSFDSNVFADREWIREVSGSDVRATATCGPIGQVGAAMSVFAFSGQIDEQQPERTHSIVVPPGTGLLRVSLNGEDANFDTTFVINNFDLYIRAGSPPNYIQGIFDYRSIRASQYDFSEVTAPVAGTWYIGVRRVDGRGRYQLTATTLAACSSNAECDDANACTSDTCDLATGKCSNTAEAAATCRMPLSPKKSSVFLKDNTKNAKDEFTWAWTKGAATAKADFGEPLSNTSYDLCLYDQAEGLTTIQWRANVPAGGTCAGEPCWKSTSSGFKYTNNELTPDGLKTLELKAGAAGKASIKVTGKGTNLLVPALPLQPKVTVQLKSSGGECWEATYSAPTKNDATQFKAKSD